MFGGLTHEPARRARAAPGRPHPRRLEHVFFADSGSVSVEVAIKMALQDQRGAGRPERHRLLTIRGGYHGDTFGAMSVCDPVGGMHSMFTGVLPQHVFADRPPADRHRRRRLGGRARALADEHADELAAVIVEPVLQGAGGMHVYPADASGCSATSPTSTACCWSSTRSPPASAAPAPCSPPSTRVSTPTSCVSARR